MAISERGTEDGGANLAVVAQATALEAGAERQAEGTADGSLDGSPKTERGPAVVPTAAAQGMPESPFVSDQSSPKASPDTDTNGLGKPLDHKLSMASSEHGSEASSGMLQSLSPHYDAERDVILRLEFLRTGEFKFIIRAVWASVAVGMALLIMAVYFKIDKSDYYYLRNNDVPIVNLAFGGPLLVALLGCSSIFYYRVYRSNLTKKRWSHRRRRACMLAGIEVTLQTVNCVFFIVPNAYSLSHTCGWFENTILWAGFVRWTIWNTLFLLFIVQAHSTNPAGHCRYFKQFVSRPDAAVMDAPLWTHWHKLVLWFTMEGVLLGLTLTLGSGGNSGESVFDPSITDCRQQQWSCHFNKSGTALISLNISCVIVYFLLWIFYVARALNNLKLLPYTGMRMANITTRLQIKMRAVTITFFTLCAICYSFVKLNTCSSYIISWFGYLPMQVVMAVVAIANAYICMPKRPRKRGILQVWLQEFAWLERDVQRKKEERASSLNPDSFEGFCLECEPMWCFETTVKMMYWSFLVYDYQEDKPGATPSPYNPDTALLLYELENWECMWERSLDTKAVVGWSSDTVVISFRGTASLANVKADLQVWRAHWPKDVGSRWLRTAPLVHQGFLRAYTANGFNDKLLERLEHILYRCAAEQREAGGKPVTVYVTGHSLGGALATLCAYDIKKRCPCAEYMINVKCYTFGAPRVGNHAFVKLYNEAVSDTWHLINNDDLITKAGKFWFLYKRTGHRVLINKLGDLVVRPSYVETAIRGVPGGASVRDHLLTQYQKAIMAVVAGQFGSKSLAHGKDGVLTLASSRGMGDVLHAAGLSVREMRVLRERGWDAYQRLLRHRAAKARSTAKRARRTGSGRSEAEAAAALDAVVVERLDKTPESSVVSQELALTPDEEAAVASESQEVCSGVMHTCQMKRSARRGRRAATICSMLHRQLAAGAPGTAPPAAPEADMPSTPQHTPPAALQAVVEEGEEGDGWDLLNLDAPPTPTTSQPREHKKGWLRSTLCRLAAGVGWVTIPDDDSLYRPSSLGTTSMSPTPSGSSDMDVRGSMRDVPIFPLVLEPGMRGAGGLPSTAEEVSGAALEEHDRAVAQAQMAANRAARERAEQNAAARRAERLLGQTAEEASGDALEEHARVVAEAQMAANRVARERAANGVGTSQGST